MSTDKDAPLEVKIKYSTKSQVKLVKLVQGDWIDLPAIEDRSLLGATSVFKMSLGVAMKLPEGFEAHIVPRSSTFKNYGIILVNSMGIIDESYSGTDDVWFTTWYQVPGFTALHKKIKAGDRICQFRIMKKQPELEFLSVVGLGAANRGGEGSTGK